MITLVVWCENMNVSYDSEWNQTAIRRCPLGSTGGYSAYTHKVIIRAGTAAGKQKIALR